MVTADSDSLWPVNCDTSVSGST